MQAERGGRLPQFHFQHEIADVNVFEHRDVPRTAMRQLFGDIDIFEFAERLAAVEIDDFPSLRTSRLPAIGAGGEVFIQ